jgi:hypothetical protein
MKSGAGKPTSIDACFADLKNELFCFSDQTTNKIVIDKKTRIAAR